MLLNLFAFSGALIAISSGVMALVMFTFGKNALHRLWGVFCVSVFVWGIGGFLIGIARTPESAELWWRIAHIGVAFIPTLFLHFVYEFLELKDRKSLIAFYLVSTIFAVLSVTSSLLIAHMRFVFGQFYYDSPPGILYPILTVYFFGLTIYSHYVLYKSYHSETIISEQTGIKQTRIRYFFLGMLISFAGGSMSFLPVYGIDLYPVTNIAIVLYPIIVGYAILRHKLFDIRVAVAQGLIFLLWIFVGARTVLSSSPQEFLINGALWISVIVLGIYLVRSVSKEVDARERIEKLVVQLETANDQQVLLIHFITHQIKGFLTKSRNVFSMALEGEFGPVPDTLKPMLEMGLESDTQGVNTVQEILNAANIKSGKVTYNMQPFDFAELVKSVVTTLKPNADKRQLALNLMVTQDSYTIAGDRSQLEHAVKNIIDNAIKYTPSGEVNISLTKEGSIVRFVEQDTGVGITQEDMAKLFTEGGHGKDSIKVNVESTGFGLYIVKNIVVAHGGKIWAESEGAGKGSKFTIELPVGQAAAATEPPQTMPVSTSAN